MYNLITFSTFTILYTTIKIPEHSHHPKKKPAASQLSLSNFLFHSPRQPHIYFVSICWPILDIPYKWNNIICVFSNRFLLTEHHVFQIYLFCKIISTSFLFLFLLKYT